MKSWLRISLSLFLVFISLTIISLVKTQQKGITQTGNFVLTVGSSIGVISGTSLFSYFLIQMIKQKKEVAEHKEDRENEEALQKCEKMLYIIRDINKSDLGTDSKVEELKSKVGPYIIDLSTKHKGFLYNLMRKGYGDIRNTVLDIFTSMKHPHFNPRRALMYFSQLEKSLGKYLNT